MSMIATRPTNEVTEALEAIAFHPTVDEAHTDQRTVGNGREAIAVVVLTEGIERIPPGVCRAIGETDFGVDSIERFPDGHREVVLR